MLRSRCLTITLNSVLALSCFFVVPLVAQDQPSAQGQPAAQGQAGTDEGSLTNKVSYFMGFNLMSNLKRQGEDIDMNMMMEGMKAAIDAPEKKSFVIGFQMMSSVKENGADLDINRIFAGMQAASTGQELGMSQEETGAMMEAFGQLMQQRQIEKMKAESARNIAITDAYMAKRATENPNIKKLDNGVQYEVLAEGDGAMPAPTDKVRINYHGTFIDGEVFDSTVSPPDGSPAEPIEMVVSQFVPGFSKTLQAMKVGSKWKVCIPGQQAYGASGRGEIGPNQALVFEISLLGIVEK